MINQTLSDFDINLDIFGSNSPYSISWSAHFDKSSLKIKFAASPKLIGGINEILWMQITNVQKFKSIHDIILNSSQSFKFTVSKPDASETVTSAGSAASYMFIITMLISIGVSLITGGSIELMWSLANTLQVMFFYAMLNLNFTPELLAVFEFMKYSNFDNPIFELIRSKSKVLMSFINLPSPSAFKNIGYSSVSIIFNFLDKFIIIFCFILFVSTIWFLSHLLSKKSNRFAEYIKKKKISLRYEGISRFSAEIVLNLSVVCMIHFSYGNFRDLFNSFSYSIAIVMMSRVIYFNCYCLFYPILYYSAICDIPSKQERHQFLFTEFDSNKSRNLLFYFYFILYRIIFSLLLICMYNYSTHQCVLIPLLNFLSLIYTVSMFKSKINNFLHTFNSIIQFAFSLCLSMFLSSSSQNKLTISGYVCIVIITIFFVINWCLVLYQTLIHIYIKIKNCKDKKNNCKTIKTSNIIKIHPVDQVETSHSKVLPIFSPDLTINASHMEEEKIDYSSNQIQRYPSPSSTKITD